ncbi:SRPBCC family protein [Cellulomonas alba]|uniref:SRPBCC domain-containing protein n=1 Tax=Cellulomonas alba TaxID=3053467 RepID=A0ABT7SH16_9CELL|nr:SRPBCC domain-containing protein [Cellulomonas alba]MDM7854819.1 SRPBCC domain-containing protein [Cellulomonas alba]
MTHPFEIGLEQELPADPEQVWAAIATGPGIDSWFMGRNEVEEREGGAVSMETGGRREDAVVTAYEPGRRFATRTSAAPDGRFMAFEYLIEGRAGGSSSVLRVVHSGLLGDDWQDEYDALRSGWPFHLHTLREYLAHFAGRTGTPTFGLRVWDGRTRDEVRTAIARALGADERLAVGLPVHADVPGLPPLDGVVVWADDDRAAVRTADGLYTFHQGAGVAVMFHHLFGAADGAEPAWQAWLAALPA